MKFLIDTNVLIPLEPKNSTDFTVNSQIVTELHRIIGEAGHHICLHKDARLDIQRDRNAERQQLRLHQLSKYQLVTTPQHSSVFISHELGEVSQSSNDWVDFQLLGALYADAVDALVTEDLRLLRRAGRIGLADRVFTVQEAINYLKRFLYDESFTPPPAVKRVDAYEIDFSVSFFDSFREDYPGFDDWARKVKLEHRTIWVIQGDQEDIPYAAICIIKPESKADFIGTGDASISKVLKICSFKVANNYIGFGYGELLLKSVFEYVRQNDFSHCFITIFDKHVSLIGLVQAFGFYRNGINQKFGDTLFLKSFSPDLLNLRFIDALDYNIQYGPHRILSENVRSFIVPIRPEFQKVLFPEIEDQLDTFVGDSEAGNSLRKAYLSHSSIKKIQSGSILFFYTSRTRKSIIAIGVVEKVIRSKNPDKIARMVSKRTIYTYNQIENLCRKNLVLAILFRQAIILNQPIHLKHLISNSFLKGAPQSIQSISNEVLKCIQ